MISLTTSRFRRKAFRGPSNTVSDAPHKLGHELFFDRTSSKRLISILRMAGFVFQTIYEVYPNNAHEKTLDTEWIRKCGESNWIVITGDKRIETVPENRQAVIDSKAKVFLLNDSNSKPEVWAAAILLGQYKMQDIIDGTTGPFFATVGKRCDSHVQRPRRPVGYEDDSPKVADASVELKNADGITTEMTQPTEVQKSPTAPSSSTPRLPFA